MLSLRQAIAFHPALYRAETSSAVSSLDICTDALTAYRANRMDGHLPDSSVWRIHTEEAQKPLLNLMEKRTAQDLSDFMAQLHSRTVMNGYDQYSVITRGLDTNPEKRRLYALKIATALAQLGAGLGCLRHFKPEQPDNFTHVLNDEVDTIAQLCAAELGLTGDMPQSGPGAYGLRTSLGQVSLRHAFALGYLREILNFLATSARSYDQIVEIGGGLGRAAFHAARDLGMAYTIIDLPMVGVTQYMFLRGNGVPATLWDGTPARPGQVRLENAYAQHDPGAFRNALFVNFDSFVEMGQTTQDAYFDLIRNAGGDLLSVNHECHKTMTREGHLQNWNLARFEAWGYKPGPRQMFWEREGYVSRSFLRKR